MAVLIRTSRLAAILSLAACGLASAAPVQFVVTPTAFILGSGYGVDPIEALGTRLDVSFTANGTAAGATLSNVGDSFSFDFGTIVFNESRILEAETDDLGVAAVFTFTDPLAGLRTVTATGVATVGPVVDAGIDFAIDWGTRDVAFGDGGLFQISMASVSFRQEGAQRTQTATITLLALPDVPMPVPEPAGLALVATALAAAGVAARRRRA